MVSGPVVNLVGLLKPYFGLDPIDPSLVYFNQKKIHNNDLGVDDGLARTLTKPPGDVGGQDLPVPHLQVLLQRQVLGHVVGPLSVKVQQKCSP